MAQQRWTDAMDELLEILMRDKAWSTDLARKTYVAILDIIEPAQAQGGRGSDSPRRPDRGHLPSPFVQRGVELSLSRHSQAKRGRGPLFFVSRQWEGTQPTSRVSASWYLAAV
jgi:hypothetical protein